MVIISLYGVLGYSFRGYVNLEFGIIISFGTILGGSVGSMYTQKLNEQTLLISMGFVFIIVGILTLILLLIF